MCEILQYNIHENVIYLIVLNVICVNFLNYPNLMHFATFINLREAYTHMCIIMVSH